MSFQIIPGHFKVHSDMEKILYNLTFQQLTFIFKYVLFTYTYKVIWKIEITIQCTCVTEGADSMT